jgi:RNA polymerase-binding transcription factor DksA
MLTDGEREQIEKLLRRERAQVLDAIGHFEDTDQDLAERAGEISLYRTHPADIGSEAQEKEKDFLLASIEGRRLYQIDDALRRLIDDPAGFGKCERCGRDIGFARLEVIPETTLCAEDAQLLESADPEGAPRPREADGNAME